MVEAFLAVALVLVEDESMATYRQTLEREECVHVSVTETHKKM